MELFCFITLIAIFLSCVVLEKQNVEMKAALKRIEEKLAAKEGKE